MADTVSGTPSMSGRWMCVKKKWLAGQSLGPHALGDPDPGLGPKTAPQWNVQIDANTTAGRA